MSAPEEAGRRRLSFSLTSSGNRTPDPLSAMLRNHCFYHTLPDFTSVVHSLPETVSAPQQKQSNVLQMSRTARRQVCLWEEGQEEGVCQTPLRHHLPHK